MKKRLFSLLCLLPFLGTAQVQIGNDIEGNAEDKRYGGAVSLSADGSVLAIGAATAGTVNGFQTGEVRVYQNIDGTWINVGLAISGESNGDLSGTDVSLSADGNILAVGATGTDPYVKVYENIDNVWNQVGATIEGESDSDQTGRSVALSADGSILAVGASRANDNGLEAGQVRVYENVDGTWTQVGEGINGQAEGDRSGENISLSADGTVLAIGSAWHDGVGTDVGQVRVFRNTAGAWTQVGADINGDVTFDYLGSAVSLSSDGNILAAGAPVNGAGFVRIFQNIADTWTQIGTDIIGESDEDFSGTSVALSADGNIVSIGATTNSDNGNNSGQVRAYQNDEGTWTQIGADINGENSGDFSGAAIATSSDGTVLAIGSPGSSNEDGDSDAGHVSVFNLTDVLLSSNDFVQANFAVYPNPAANFVNVQLTEGLQLERVNVYTLSGQLVKTERFSVIPIDGLANGTYILEVVTDQGKAAKTIVVQ